MAILPIVEIPDPILRKRARKVRRIDKKTLTIAHNMVETMRNAGGVGLAANQVGELQRIIVIQMPDEEEARIYFNPEITKSVGEREVEEGCLSLPGYRGLVTRSVWIRFRGTDHTEKVIKFQADNLLSQALEHEVDHLNGILYTDHLIAHENLYKIEDDPILGSSDIPRNEAQDDESYLDTPASHKIN